MPRPSNIEVKGKEKGICELCSNPFNIIRWRKTQKKMYYNYNNMRKRSKSYIDVQMNENVKVEVITNS